MPDAWVDRPGTGNRLGGERAVRPGAAQAGSECCRLAVHFILFRSSLHTSLSSCALGQPRHHPLYEGAPDIREACLGADLADTEQSRRHLAAVDAMLQGE